MEYTRNTVSLLIQGERFEHFSIPLVFDNRYFLVEAMESTDLLTVFWFDKGVLKVDFLRNEISDTSTTTCFTDKDHVLTFIPVFQEHWLYRIHVGRTREDNPEEETRIELATNDGIAKLPIHCGMLVLGGPMVVVNRVTWGIPVGMYLYKDSKIMMGLPLPPEFRQLIIFGDSEPPNDG